MKNIINECYQFIKDCGLPYAFCGGYALELFTNQEKRTHSDINITLFEEDRKHIVNYILNKGWYIYYPMPEINCLKKITNPQDKQIIDCLYLWAIKPDCSFIKIEPKPGKSNLFDFEITDTEQKNFDFIDIIFNSQKKGMFFCNKEKKIGRKLDQAILYYKNIPFLAPEVILYIISNPAYVESDYHREKTNGDFAFVAPLLSKESLNWLITAIENTYLDNPRLARLKPLQH